MCAMETEWARVALAEAAYLGGGFYKNGSTPPRAGNVIGQGNTNNFFGDHALATKMAILNSFATNIHAV